MGMLNQVKQAMQMRKETKRMQAEIEKITCEYTNGGITCVARGDFTIASIKITPDVLKEALKSKQERFEIMLGTVINGALKGVKKQTQEMVAKMMQGGAVGDLLEG